MLLDRLMVALHHALEDGDTQEIKKINQLYRSGAYGGAYFHDSQYKGKSASEPSFGYRIGSKSGINTPIGRFIYLV